MRRKIQLALVAGAMATAVVPATPAQASMICQTGDPLTDRVVCGTYYLVTGTYCKVTGSRSCAT